MKLNKDIPIVVATTNRNKIEEYKVIFKNFILLSLDDIGYSENIEETGKTFNDNAYIKAKNIFDFIQNKKIKAYVLADDSGLVVKSLKGAPGIYSARFSGENATYQSNREALLNKMARYKFNFQRRAYLTTHICFITIDGKVLFRKGKTYGRITKEEKGDKSFGYNCVFYSYVLKKTFGEACISELKVNHRFKAARKILKLFK